MKKSNSPYHKFFRRISYQDEAQMQAKVFTQNCALARQSVTDNWCQMCFSTARGVCRVMECIRGSDRVDVRAISVALSAGPFPQNRRFVSTVCQRVWDIASLRESQPSGHTQPHNDFWSARRKRASDLVIYLGGTLHLWALEFIDILSGRHCLTLNDLKSVKYKTRERNGCARPLKSSPRHLARFSCGE